jgi:hypothetical protein
VSVLRKDDDHSDVSRKHAIANHSQAGSASRFRYSPFTRLCSSTPSHGGSTVGCRPSNSSSKTPPASSSRSSWPRCDKVHARRHRELGVHVSRYELSSWHKHNFPTPARHPRSRKTTLKSAGHATRKACSAWYRSRPCLPVKEP